MGPQRPDAAAQLLLPHQRDEAGALLSQPRDVVAVFAGRQAELGGNRAARKRQQYPPRIGRTADRRLPAD